MQNKENATCLAHLRLSLRYNSLKNNLKHILKHLFWGYEPICQKQNSQICKNFKKWLKITIKFCRLLKNACHVGFIKVYTRSGKG